MIRTLLDGLLQPPTEGSSNEDPLGMTLGGLSGRTIQ
jgi:hypothetical protein